MVRHISPLFLVCDLLTAHSSFFFGSSWILLGLRSQNFLQPHISFLCVYVTGFVCTCKDLYKFCKLLSKVYLAFLLIFHVPAGFCSSFFPYFCSTTPSLFFHPFTHCICRAFKVHLKPQHFSCTILFQTWSICFMTESEIFISSVSRHAPVEPNSASKFVCVCVCNGLRSFTYRW